MHLITTSAIRPLRRSPSTSSSPYRHHRQGRDVPGSAQPSLQAVDRFRADARDKAVERPNYSPLHSRGAGRKASGGSRQFSAPADRQVYVGGADCRVSGSERRSRSLLARPARAKRRTPVLSRGDTEAERGKRHHTTAQIVSLSRSVSGLSNAQRAIASLRRNATPGFSLT